MKKPFKKGIDVLFVFLILTILPILLQCGQRKYAAHYSLPSPEEAPPQWDTEGLMGTIWEADMRTAPDSSHQSDVLFQYCFLPGRRVTLEIIEIEEQDPEQSEEDLTLRQALRDALLPKFEGSYHVDGHQLHVEVEMLGRPRRDIIEIRNHDLYYHGAQMKHLDNLEPAPSSVQSPGIYGTYPG